jgi:hypothetical protein
MTALTGDLLDTNEGLDVMRQACADAGACMPALRDLTVAFTAGEITRPILIQCAQAQDDWAYWCFENLYPVCDQTFRMFFLELAIHNDAGAACFVDRTFELTDLERTYLRGIWHSEYRLDGVAEFPAFEAALQLGGGSWP